MVEFLDPGNVRGWTYVADQAAVHLQVKAVLNGAVVGAGRAEIMRSDLAQAGIGQGDHAFDIRLERPVSPEDLQRLEVVAVSPAGQEFPLEFADHAQIGGGAPLDAPRMPAAPGRLRAFPLPAVDVTQYPVFILGAARSGTSAVAQALLTCGEYQGFQEGHFLWLLQQFLETIASFYALNGVDGLPERQTMLSNAPYTYITSSVRAAFVAAVAEMFPTRKWIDKTPRPQMISAARLMQEMWPNARFIFMKRRGIENVVSRLIKFPEISFRDHCQDWATSMEAWLTVRDLLKPAALEVEQLALARAPDRVGTVIGQHLAMPRDAVRRLKRSLRSDLPEQSSDIRAPRVNISNVGWTGSDITEFRRICGSMMAAFGYGYGEEYFASPVASVSF